MQNFQPEAVAVAEMVWLLGSLLKMAPILPSTKKYLKKPLETALSVFFGNGGVPYTHTIIFRYAFGSIIKYNWAVESI